jgi:hypothetical protein
MGTSCNLCTASEHPANTVATERITPKAFGSPLPGAEGSRSNRWLPASLRLPATSLLGQLCNLAAGYGVVWTIADGDLIGMSVILAVQQTLYELA